MRQFIGGPFDGHPLNENDDDYPVHTFDMPNERMAVYEISEDGEFRFVECAAADIVAMESQDDGEPECCADPWSAQ